MSWSTVMMPNYAAPNLTFVRGEGAHLYTSEGTQYLDLMAGVAVNALGHAHPAIVAAVQHQVTQLAHTSNLYGNEPSVALATALRGIAPGRKTFFCNSGTEANEAALKLVRRHAHEQDRQGVVLAFDKSFHGRTMGSLALTGQPKYHAGFGPLPGNIVHVPYNDPAALEAAFDAHPVIGVFAEFIQGEGGVHPMTGETAAALGKLTQSNGALLVADEVQTGIGRTGKWFGYEHHGLDPDVVTLAKGLGGGLPIGATLVRDDLANALPPGTHGSTFGGNAVSCAAGLAVLSTIANENLVARARRLGQAYKDAVAAEGVAARGQGLLLGIPGQAADAVKAMAAQHVLVGQAGPETIRVAPPLIVSEDEFLATARPVSAAASR